ncbi:thioredoxin [Candidatus Roizmanbacteria bacterium CG10_big_fil_rev_8_21_14_0_10_39_12]|uniref:Thioredoxin n=1 Tax=Candidatus Roizmanbacteria bacterium CG10_big_fil_rev_8_21_14_0_10_39_12 TaxID=1974852 RepID=A0A2M8KP02_9BACT|nr:MAG: thioredoxin [Candidatus Roizmanbacteria bacterium CG10_big_fil_rev_8_21_14_0_10_39_12]
MIWIKGLKQYCDTCAHCTLALEALNRIKKDKPDLEIEKIDLLKPEGQEMAQKYGIMASPGIVIDGKLTFQGGGSKRETAEKSFAELAASYL